MKIEIKTDGAYGKTVGMSLIKNVTFEDVGKNDDSKTYRVSFTDHAGKMLSAMPTFYVDKADIKRLAKAS